eukprot:TRINITY_DN82495_c0_g1_i1.p1 TRINITY_DN82495_c0_g1~~TRINITY_DN82495_c0_g1_i1.p1  ORF type:complete len:304 (+),score=31.54 TRINITY_DN82495_c0_g1_i1:130-1041(+)
MAVEPARYEGAFQRAAEDPVGEPPQLNTEKPGALPKQNTKGIYKLVDKGKDFFVRHLDPRFIHFDKPFFLAIIVAFTTWAVVGVLHWNLSIDCTVSPAAHTGRERSQVRFITESRAAGRKLCVMEAELWRTYEDDASGVGVLQAMPCMPRAWLFKPWHRNVVQGVVSAKLLPFAEEGLQWCSDAVFGNAAECEAEAGEPCLPCDLGVESLSTAANSTNTVFKMVYAEKVCPKPTHVFGIALSYAHHFQGLMTPVIVFVLMASRVLHQKGPEGKQGLCGPILEEVEGIVTAEVNSAADKWAWQA